MQAGKKVTNVKHVIQMKFTRKQISEMENFLMHCVSECNVIACVWHSME